MRAVCWVMLLAAGCGGSSSRQCAGGVCPDGGVPDRGLVDAAAPVDAAPRVFVPGHVYIAGARNGKIFEYEFVPGAAGSLGQLNELYTWSHPSFYPDYANLVDLPDPYGQPPARGPGGLAFDGHGHLVVAALQKLCAFSAPGVLLTCVDKLPVPDGGSGDLDGGVTEATQQMAVDSAGNLYATSATGARDHINVYGPDLGYRGAVSLPAGGATGISCDPQQNLYVASQSTAAWPYTSTIATLQWLGADAGFAPPSQQLTVAGLLEGLLVIDSSTFLAAVHDDNTGLGDGGGDLPPGLRLFDRTSGSVMQPAFVNPESDAGLADALRLPIGVTIDSLGNVYTADWKDPLGTAAADLYVFSPDGTLLARQATSAVHGPVGIAVAGTALYGGPPPP